MFHTTPQQALKGDDDDQKYDSSANLCDANVREADLGGDPSGLGLGR